MRRSQERILTTHVGALPDPQGVWNDPDLSDARLRAAVDEVVALQKSAGIDLINEGELTKGANWVTFVNSRLSGFEPQGQESSANLLFESRDWIAFADFYKAAIAGGTLFEQTRAAPSQARGPDWACTGPVRYVGQTALAREIETLKAALGDTPVGDAFLTSTAPASLEPTRANRYYDSDEAYLFALAEALQVEYEAIAAAGFMVQVDDAWLAALWDRIGIAMGLAAYKKYCMLRVEALNHALRNIPEEQIRYHLCWGSWHGPHSEDIPMADMVDVMLSVKAQAYLFEAANARHEHEYVVWKDVKLPDGKILIPGVVSHATPLIEHPELVALRIRRFTDIVGKENVIAGADCGLGLRCHPQIAWAKLKALSEGARLASA
jgi:5-methyltetrahydropteroyltriglutamate--homocysteine methyltransferase